MKVEKAIYMVAKEKVRKYREKHSEATIEGACKAVGVSVSNFYYTPKGARAYIERKKIREGKKVKKKPGPKVGSRQKPKVVAKRKYNRKPVLNIPELEQSSPMTAIILQGVPSEVIQVVRGL